MEEELNIWEYLQAIVRRWPVVLAGLALTVVAMGVFWLVQPTRYRATATLLATAPRYEWRFDTGILPIVDSRKDWTAEAMGLARSQDVIQNALEQVSIADRPAAKPAALTDAIETRSGPGEIFYLTVTWPTPEVAIDLTNALADQVIKQARLLYSSGDDLARFQASLDEAEEKVVQAEAALQAFQGETGTEILRKGFEGLVGYSADERELDLLSDELAAHRAAVASLTLMADQSRRILAEGGSPDAFPWELADGPVLAARGLVTRTLPLSDSDAIIRLMEQEKQEVEAIAHELEQRVEALQERQAQQAAEHHRLTRERNLAEEAYAILARKVSELSARQLAESANVHIVQRATKATPVRMSTSVAISLAVILGLMIGVVGALVAERLSLSPEGSPSHLKDAEVSTNSETPKD